MDEFDEDMDFFQFQANLMDGTKVESLGDLCRDAKCTLVVNISTKCALMRDDLNSLVKVYSEYKDKGLQILAFPCH